MSLLLDHNVFMVEFVHVSGCAFSTDQSRVPECSTMSEMFRSEAAEISSAFSKNRRNFTRMRSLSMLPLYRSDDVRLIGELVFQSLDYFYVAVRGFVPLL
jgi:hypothetical protein